MYEDLFDEKVKLLYNIYKIINPDKAVKMVSNTHKRIVKEFESLPMSLQSNYSDEIFQQFNSGINTELLLNKIDRDATNNLTSIENEIVDLSANDRFMRLLNLWLDYEKKSTERHLPGYNYCGPGTRVVTRLISGSEPINDLDRSCRVHDIEYMIFSGDDKLIRKSDMDLLDKIKTMDNKNFFSKLLVRIAFKVKNALFDHSVWEKFLYSNTHGLSHSDIQMIGRWAADKYLSLNYEL